jgi:hypothetical protein
VLGREVDSIVRRFRSGMPTRFKIASGPVVLEGVELDVDEHSGKARRVERVRARSES